MADKPTDDQTVLDETTEELDLVALQAENASLRDRLLRTLADSENVRRRAARDAEDARNYAVADLSRELLTVVDNLRRATEAAEGQAVDGAATAPLVQGIQAVERSLMTTLERFGVRRIEARDSPFDPMRHEAMMEVDDPGLAPGSVVDVMEEGYTIHDRLLRPARVSVTLARPARVAGGSPAPEDRRGPAASRDE